MSLTGTVKEFNDTRFGFITPNAGGHDVFIHITQCNSAESLSKDDVVTYDTRHQLLNTPWGLTQSPWGLTQGTNCSILHKAGTLGAPRQPGEDVQMPSGVQRPKMCSDVLLSDVQTAEQLLACRGPYMQADLVMQAIEEDHMSMIELQKLRVALRLYIEGRLEDDM